MKAYVLALGLAIITFGVNILTALDLPATIPEGPGWATCWTKSSPTTCGKATWDTYALNTTACRDYTNAEKATVRMDFDNDWKGHYVYRGDATYTYNCHGYVFDSSGSWGGDPANWLGADNPCYQVDATGPIYRWGADHSSFAGTDKTYNGKCGKRLKCDHDDAIYGAHTDRWKQRPKS